MFEKPTAQYPLGLEAETDKVKGALLTEKGGKPEILRLFTTDIRERDSTPRHLTLLHTVQPNIPRDKLRRALFVTGMTTRQTLIRTLNIQLTKEKDIDAVLAFQAEPLLPYPVEEAVLDRVILSSNEESSQVAVFATRRDHLEPHLEFYQSLNIEPEAVSCHPSALSAFSRVYCEVEEPLIITHLGTTDTCCLLVDDGKVLASFSMNVGVAALMKVAQETGVDLNSVDFTAIANDESSPLFSPLAALEQGLNRTVFALGKQAKGQSIQKILMTGEGATQGTLSQYLSQRCEKKEVFPAADENSSIKVQDLQRYAISIGLALGCLPKSINQTNFRRQEFSYPNPWKRLKQPLTIYLLSCLLVTGLIWQVSNILISRHETQIRQQYEGLLAILGTEHQTFEQDVQKVSQSDVQALEDLSPKAISRRLDNINSNIKGTQHTFPLMPNIPRVSDVLAWIVHHPKISNIDPETGVREPRLKIESFNYSMVKRPEKTKQREHYQVKVEFEFSSDEPKWAREFHDALIVPNDFIDPKSEVKWSADQGKYRTSFFLKDRTYYP